MILTCQHCRLDFNADKKHRKFCSKACYGAGEVSAREAAKCIHCHKLLEGKGRLTRKFCDHNCYTGHKIANGYVTAECKHCKTVFTSLKGKHREYCSRTCASHMKTKYLPDGAIRKYAVVKPKTGATIEAVTIKARDSAAWANAEVKFSESFKGIQVCPSPNFGRYGELLAKMDAPKLFREIPYGCA